MRSLYFGVALALLGAVSFALLAFVLISGDIENRYVAPVFDAMDQLELESARDALDHGGPAQAASYTRRLDQRFGDAHYLLDARGVDVVTHADRAGFLPAPPAVRSRGGVGGRFIVARRSADGRYWLLSIGPRKAASWPLLPYLWVIVAVAAALCALAAIGVVWPIHRLTATVERFGRGDLSARSTLRRRDEIGGLAQAFDDMADRIEGLLAGERRLLQDISHELRSPLARLKLAVHLAGSSADPKAALDRIARDVDRLTELTSEIVEMVRLEGDPRALRRETTDLGRLVDEIIADCCAEAAPAAPRIHVDRRFAGDVACDRELIRRAIENVVRNALLYSSHEASVEIEMTQDGHASTIAVRDYGPGVPDEALVHIFEPFFRADEAREASSGGVGLGLSIAKRAVQLHGGAISAENARPGLRVEIRLPLAEAMEPDPSRMARPMTGERS